MVRRIRFNEMQKLCTIHDREYFFHITPKETVCIYKKRANKQERVSRIKIIEFIEELVLTNQ